MHFEGSNGSVTLDEDRIRIRHKGFANFLTAGAHGEISILLSNISAVQFKSAGFMAGFIQFSIVGLNTKPGGVFEATKDVNAVLFSKEQEPQFEVLRNVVEERLTSLRSASKAQSTPAPAISIADELLKLAALKEKGILSEGEFAAQKDALLRRNL
jgi:hypothetical protein